MIEQQLQFSEQSVKMALSSKRFLAEACVETVLMEADFPHILEQVRGWDLTRKKRTIMNVLKTHTPAECVDFRGLRMFSTTEWWIAIVKLTPTFSTGLRKDQDVFLLLRGWNNVHGIAVDCPSFGTKDMLQEEMAEKIEPKRDKGYRVIFTLENLALGTGGVALPAIPGLSEPVPDPTLSSVEELMKSVDEDEEEEVTLPPKASKKKPKVKKKSASKKKKDEEKVKVDETPQPSPEEADTAQEEMERKKRLREKMKKKRKESEW